MRKIILLEHVSLDGFAAGPNGEMDWIHVAEDLFEVAYELTEQSDAALYGRNTFNMMDSYWPTAAERAGATAHDRQHSQWYNKVKKFVMSNTLDTDRNDVHVIGHEAARKVGVIMQEPGGTILMLGSPSAAQTLMMANLITEYFLFVNPVVLGSGIPLFPQQADRLHLGFLESKPFSGGVVLLRYSNT